MGRRRERICVNLLLMIWGAYAETASLIANMLYQLMVGEPSVRAAVREEVDAAGTEPSCLLLENMPYTVALSSETLRVRDVTCRAHPPPHLPLTVELPGEEEGVWRRG